MLCSTPSREISCSISAAKASSLTCQGIESIESNLQKRGVPLLLVALWSGIRRKSEDSYVNRYSSHDMDVYTIYMLQDAHTHTHKIVRPSGVHAVVLRFCGMLDGYATRTDAMRFSLKRQDRTGQDRAGV